MKNSEVNGNNLDQSSLNLRAGLERARIIDLLKTWQEDTFSQLFIYFPSVMPKFSINAVQGDTLDIDKRLDQLEFCIDELLFDPPRFPGTYFSLGNDLKIVSCDGPAASLLGISISDRIPLGQCPALAAEETERIESEAKLLIAKEKTGPRFLRINIGSDVLDAKEPYCITLRMGRSETDEIHCNCCLERISSRPDAHAFQFGHSKVLEKTGIVVWSMQKEDRRFNLATPLDCLIDAPAPQMDCSLEEWIQFIHKDDQKAFQEEFTKFIRGETDHFHFRYRLAAKSSETKWISTIARHKQLASNAKNDQILGLHKDESDIPNIQGELRLFSFLAKKVHSPIVITDPEGRITWLNKAFSLMTGYKPEELVGYKPGHLLQGELSDTDTILHMRDRIRRKKAFHAELVNYTKTGVPYWVKIDANPLVNEEGEVTHYIAFQTDISESRKARNAIQRNESKFRSLFDNSLDALLLVSTDDGQIIEANESASNRFQTPRLEGMALKQLFKEETSLEEIHLDSLLGDSLDDWRKNCDFRQIDGSVLPVEVTACRIPMGESEALLVTFRDVSDKRLLEEQLRRSQKMEAVGKLAGGVAHDFNNLLAGMRGFTELLSNSEHPSTRDRVYISELLKITERARVLTSRLLSFSRRQSSKPIVANLNKIINGFSPMLSRMIHEDIQFTTDLQPGIANSRLDTTQIEQVIMNLVVNAQEATNGHEKSICLKSGEVALTGSELFVTGSPIPGKYVYLEVEDNGHGIKAEVVGKIFEPFFTTKEGAGTGLGLSIVYGIVDKSNGHLDVSSIPMQGTKFRALFPAVDQQMPPDQGNEQMDRLPAAGKAGKANILIAEDQGQVREILELGLGQSGYRLLIAKDGEEAIELASNFDENINLLLTDAIMPKMHGTQLATAVRKIYPNLRVVVMSGLPQSETMSSKADKIEIDAYVNKPFSIRKLVDLINGILEKQTTLSL